MDKSKCDINYNPLNHYFNLSDQFKKSGLFLKFDMF